MNENRKEEIGFLFRTVRLFAITVWAVVGFALWLPFLVRTVMMFNGAMIYATVTRHRARLITARQLLDVATAFYVLGFRNIHDWTAEEPPQELPELWLSGSSGNLLAGFVTELGWAVSWWTLLIYHQSLGGLLLQYGPELLSTGWITFLAGIGLTLFVVMLVRAGKREPAEET